MASAALAIQPLAHPTETARPCLRVAFNRFPGVPSREREWWFEPKFPGVYRLASVNGVRPPYFWQGLSSAGISEWLIAGRAFLREDRSWAIRLATGPQPASVNQTHVTVIHGT